MAVTRMRADTLRAAARVNRAKVEATTEDEIRRQTVKDGCDPGVPAGPARIVMPPAEVRRRTGLSQEAFAKAINVPVATWRNWEQGRKTPDPAARSLLALLADDPKQALRVLSPVQASAPLAKRG